MARFLTAVAVLVFFFFVDTQGFILAQTQGPILPRLSRATAQFFRNNLAIWSEFVAQLPRLRSDAPLAIPQTTAPPFGGTWRLVTAAPQSGLCNPLLLTDGTVLVHVCDTGHEPTRPAPRTDGSHPGPSRSAIIRRMVQRSPTPVG
jgi:hypothetical protein